jgi:formamidopyrimidine-DNA glycosylase
MPELPEVETTCAGIRPHLLNAKVSSIAVREFRLRWPIDKNIHKKLCEKVLMSVERRAKYILLTFPDGILVIHLGMSGSLRVLNKEISPKKHDHFDIFFSNKKILRYHDPRRFGAMLWIEGALNEHKLFAKLGLEPLLADFNGEYLFERSRKRKVTIKQFIMDAHVVVGVGNIYANEAMFVAGIHPCREAGSVSKKRYQVLADEIKKVLVKAIQQGGTTLKDFQGPDGKPGYFVQKLQVYGRLGQPCFKCGRELEEVRLNNRSTIFCRKCQK